jgi:error-prone DNA polymerase
MGCRASVPVSSLIMIAEADGMRESLGLARRKAVWAIKRLREEPLNCS